MAGLLALVVIGTTIWVGVDASGRDFSRSGISRSTGGWVLGSLLLWLVFFPLYLGQRGRAPRKGERLVPTTGKAAHLMSWAPPAAAASAPLDAGAVGIASPDFRPCSECAEPIRAAARKCRYCGWTESA
jgi:hypothetical protein